MPIRINFLAEHRALEQERRRDPVKRATAVAVLLVGLLVGWGAYLQVRQMGINSTRKTYEARFERVKAAYNKAVADKAAVDHARQRLKALGALATNRFLWANYLDSMQFTTMPDVQLTEVRGVQAFTVVPGVAAKTNATGKLIAAAKPAVSRERVVVNLQVTDVGEPPGESISPYQDTLRSHPFMKARGGDVRLINRSPPMQVGGRRFVKFELECAFAESERFEVRP